MLFRRSVHQTSSGEGGFTLIEVLLALLIAVMIIGVLYLSFRTVNENTIREQDRLERTQIARAVLDQLSQEVASTVSITDVEKKPLFEGVDSGLKEDPKDALGFVTTASADGRPRWIRYVYDEKEKCYTRIDRNPWSGTLDTRVPMVLDPLVTGLNVRYYDGTDWIESWSRENPPATVIPREVEITVWVGEEGGPRERAWTRIALPAR